MDSSRHGYDPALASEIPARRARLAGAFLLAAGVMNLAWGIVALAGKQHFAEGSSLGDTLILWGWIALFAGAIQMLAGWLVLERRVTGMALGLVVALMGILLNLLWIGVYPVWAVLAIIANGLVIWAVTASDDD